MDAPERKGHRLSVSPDRGTWILTALYSLFTLAAGIAFAFWAVFLAGEGRAAVPFAAAFGIFAAVVLSESVLAVVRRYNRTFWLDGTVLVARRVGGTVRCDLSRASVRLHRGPYGLGGLRLTVTAGPGARPITVPLRLDEPWNATTADELRALARAITAGREDEPREAAEAREADGAGGARGADGAGGARGAAETAAELLRLADSLPS